MIQLILLWLVSLNSNSTETLPLTEANQQCIYSSVQEKSKALWVYAVIWHALWVYTAMQFCSYMVMRLCGHVTYSMSVADPGFPRGGGANSPEGAPTYNFAKISQKLHEIERIWTPRGAHIQNFTM